MPFLLLFSAKMARKKICDCVISLIFSFLFFFQWRFTRGVVAIKHHRYVCYDVDGINKQ